MGVDSSSGECGMCGERSTCTCSRTAPCATDWPAAAVGSGAALLCTATPPAHVPPHMPQIGRRLQRALELRRRLFPDPEVSGSGYVLLTEFQLNQPPTCRLFPDPEVSGRRWQCTGQTPTPSPHIHYLPLPLPQVTNGYRLINGEGDGLPGLVVDVYGSVAVVKTDGEGAAAFYDVQVMCRVMYR